MSLSVVHVNHGLRGAESDGDEAFVAELARTAGLPLHSRRIHLIGGNIESEARDGRRHFFAELRSFGTVDLVATGHTRSDQAETVLYRLLRGSGTAGLCGILPSTAEGIIRPLLVCTRAETEQFLVDRSLPWRDDRTNADTLFVRNRLRHIVLPHLVEQIGPAVPDILAVTAAVAQDEESWWATEMERLAPTLLTQKKTREVLVRADILSRMHPAVARRTVRHAIRLAKGDLRGINLPHVERLLALAAQQEGHGRLQAPGIDVFRSFEWLRIGFPRTESRQERDYAWEIGKTNPRRFQLPDYNLVFEFDTTGGGTLYTGKTDEIRLDRLVWPLELRNWHPGDALRLPGRSEQKIKSLFQEGRIPLWERHGWPVLTSAGQVVWTRRFGAAESYLPEHPASPVLRIIEEPGD